MTTIPLSYNHKSVNLALTVSVISCTFQIQLLLDNLTNAQRARDINMIHSVNLNPVKIWFSDTTENKPKFGQRMEVEYQNFQKIIIMNKPLLWFSLVKIANTCWSCWKYRIYFQCGSKVVYIISINFPMLCYIMCIDYLHCNCQIQKIRRSDFKVWCWETGLHELN